MRKKTQTTVTFILALLFDAVGLIRVYFDDALIAAEPG